MTEPEYFAGPAAGLVHQGEEEAVPHVAAVHACAKLLGDLATR